MKKEYQIWSLIRVFTDDATLQCLDMDYKEQVLHERFDTYKEARKAQLELVVDAVYNKGKEIQVSKEYYNTLNESKSDVRVSRDKAKKQKDEIFAIFRHTLRPMTPAEIWDGYGFKNNNTPLTSIRRAITNLEAEGLLKKTDIQKPGVYGKLNYCWIYKEKIINNDDQLTLI